VVSYEAGVSFSSAVSDLVIEMGRGNRYLMSGCIAKKYIQQCHRIRPAGDGD
jgi:hypothetical protein